MTTTPSNPDRRCRLFVPIKVGKTALLSRDGTTAVLTVVRSDDRVGAEVEFAGQTLWLPRNQLRTVYFAETRIGLYLIRAFSHSIRLAIEAPQYIQVRRPHPDGQGTDGDDSFCRERNREGGKRSQNGPRGASAAKFTQSQRSVPR